MTVSGDVLLPSKHSIKATVHERVGSKMVGKIIASTYKAPNDSNNRLSNV